ncbi:MAG: DNA transposition protein [Candidatus Accumulibacter sp.]|nr:DNA transposition protein [Accumulibacter sp.]
MSQFANIHNLGLVAAAVEKLVSRNHGLPGFAVLYGPAGWGKSTALLAAANQSRAYYVQLRSAWGRKALLEKILIEMSIRPAGTIPQLLDQVCQQLAASGRPLMIDEFDYCLKSNGMVELVRDIYEASQSPVILAGEELLPQKLIKWERFHSRVLSWIPAQPVSVADAKALAPIYCPVPVADDWLAMAVAASGGSVRRVCVNLANAADEAAMEGWRAIDREVWGKRPIYTGEAPARRAA